MAYSKIGPRLFKIVFSWFYLLEMVLEDLQLWLGQRRHIPQRRPRRRRDCRAVQIHQPHIVGERGAVLAREEARGKTDDVRGGGQEELSMERRF